MKILQMCGRAVLVYIVFTSVAVIHEMGHYTAARCNGLSVEEVEIGFGPLLFETHAHGTKFSLRLGQLLDGATFIPELDSEDLLRGLHPGDDQRFYRIAETIMLAGIATGIVFGIFLLAIRSSLHPCLQNLSTFAGWIFILSVVESSVLVPSTDGYAFVYLLKAQMGLKPKPPVLSIQTPGEFVWLTVYIGLLVFLSCYSLSYIIKGKGGKTPWPT